MNIITEYKFNRILKALQDSDNKNKIDERLIHISKKDFNKLAKCVKKSNCKLFGGIIRSVVDKSYKINDIDVWAPNDKCKDDLIQSLKAEFVKFNCPMERNNSIQMKYFFIKLLVYYY